VSSLAPNAPQIWDRFGEKWAVRGTDIGLRAASSVGCIFRPTVVRLDKKGQMGRIWGQRCICSHMGQTLQHMDGPISSFNSAMEDSSPKLRPLQDSFCVSPVRLLQWAG
jgi:hypothetical protein